MIGGNGNDSLDGGTGSDFVDGSEERWNPYEGPPGADRLSCGPGTDYVIGDGGGDTLTGDCEQGYDAAGRYFFSPFYDGSPGGAWFPSFPISPQVQVAAPSVDAGLARVDVPVTCTAPGYCSGTVALTASTARIRRPRTAARAKLGRAGFTVRVGAPQKVRIRLKAAGRRLLRGRRTASATAVLRLRDWVGRIVTSERKVDLRLPRLRQGGTRR